MQRVAVVGVAGTGKTTMAASLAAKLGLEHVELDALYWEPGWTKADPEVFRRRVQSVAATDRWVMCGNYSKVRDLVWQRADSVVWLDYPLAVTLMRLLRRTLRRVRSGEELWHGNRERFAAQFLSHDSLFLWALETHSKHRATYPALLANERYRHLTAVRLRTPRAAQAWLDSLS
jgi:adenylate kinase family enzyme